MQGSYNKNGLPRPYYMKPSKGKKSSPYDNLPTNYFNNPRRKLLGYLVMLVLLGLTIYSVGEALRGSPDPVYELEDFPSGSGSDINNILAVNENEKDSNNIGLAGNLAMNSKGDVGRGVNEAPKGGIANEAPIVGNDEDIIIKGKKKASKDADDVVKAVKDKDHDPLADFEENIDLHHVDEED